MDIEQTKGYGIAVSDLEGGWNLSFKKKLRKISQRIILKNLSLLQRLKLLYYFNKERGKASKLDLSDIKARGMKNLDFLKQQLDYIAMFSALSRIVGKDNSLRIMFRVMEKTAPDAFSQFSPEHETIIKYGNSLEFFRKYFEPLPNACSKAGCLEMVLTENTEKCFQYDITWCVWLELSKKMGIPEACIPNCYADDYAYPSYFQNYGIKYSRKGTLAKGSSSCDTRFELLN